VLERQLHELGRVVGGQLVQDQKVATAEVLEELRSPQVDPVAQMHALNVLLLAIARPALGERTLARCVGGELGVVRYHDPVDPAAGVSCPAEANENYT
jgi:hypothetical protein